MAMTSCLQCDEAMSNYASSCPHCGKKNPAAPEAILLQEKEELSSIGHQQVHEPQVVEPSPSPESEKICMSDEARQHHQRIRSQWLTELREEWITLTSGKRTALQMLFGFAVLVGILVFVYGLVP